MLQHLPKQVLRRFVGAGSLMRQGGGATVLTFAAGVAYFLAARVGLLLMAPTGVAVFWPAAGVASGILIALGRTARWPVAVGVIAANITANLMGDRNVLSSSIFSLSDAGEALLVGWIIERHLGSDFSLGRLQHVLTLLAAAIIGAAVSGIGGTLGYKLGHNPDDPAWTVWRQWVASDIIGIIAVAPLVISIVAGFRAPPSRRELVEGAAAIIAVTAAAGLIIFMLPSDWWETSAAVVLMFPVVLWVVARCPPAFAAAAVFVVSLIFMAASSKLGNFGSTSLSMEYNIVSAQITILGTALCTFILSALFAERRQHEAVVAESEARLQEALGVGSVLTFDWDVSTDLVQRSSNSVQILGHDPEQSLSATSFVARIHPGDVGRVKELWSSLNPSNSTASISYRFLRPDGREIWLQETSKAEFDAVRRLVRVRGLGLDITQRKQADIRIAADLDAMKRLHGVGVECAGRENGLKYCLERILEAAVAIAGANKGTIQLFDQASGMLTIAAQIGFEDPFVKYFARVSGSTTSCGAAMQSRARVVVEDVMQNEIFAGKPSLNLLLDAGVRAVTSVPLIGSSKKILGMFSTYFSLPYRPGERELQLLDLLARQAADYLERNIAEEHQKILMAELDHRVKNVLARVIAVADSTRQGGGSIDEFVRSYHGRIQSMAAAHTLLSQTGWQGTDLAALVRNQLEPYATDANMTIAGTDIMLGASASQALAMVVHELVTNAVKYGALSIPGGRVLVSWERKLNGNAATLILAWREVGGPPPAGQVQFGYGARLIQELVPYELAGRVDLMFAAEGVSCKIEFPIERV
jgi:two-component sensor histidine kinase/integral membrane sensor domain MASE1